MVTDFEDLKELGKEMEQISDQNDQEKILKKTVSKVL